MRKNKLNGSSEAFTLVELLVVIGCIMILATLTVVALTSFTDEAKTKATQSLLSQIEVALNSYHTVFLSYPSSEGQYDGSQNLYYLLAQTMKNENASGLDNLSLMPNSEMKKLSAPLSLKQRNLDGQHYLVDSWGQRIIYKNPGQSHADGHNNNFYVDLESYGPNGVADEDYSEADDDINNWKLHARPVKQTPPVIKPPVTQPPPTVSQPKPVKPKKTRPKTRSAPVPPKTQPVPVQPPRTSPAPVPAPAPTAPPTETCSVCQGKKTIPHDECNATGRITVPHETCSPTGTVVCPKCNGATQITDPKCKGTGKITDPACGGKGTVTKTCSTCSGSGITFDPLTKSKKFCATCSGAGKVTESCPTCQGTSKVNCPTCGASGKVTDPACGGTGTITCPVCNGTKETEINDPACNGTGKTPCATCDGTGVIKK
ncbi:MAG: hypothetical protein AAB019_09185 [Planctomycetota bacterium]